VEIVVNVVRHFMVRTSDWLVFFSVVLFKLICIPDISVLLFFFLH